MPIDGYFIKVQVDEFKKILTGCKLRKIKGISKHAFLFTFYKQNYYHLLISLSPNASYMRISEDLDLNIKSHFLTSLKKELENSTLTNIFQHKKDRIVYFEFSKYDPFFGSVKRFLVAELMGRNSNLILLDENQIIIDAFFKHLKSDTRSVLPKLNYNPFPTSKKVFQNKDLEKLNSPQELFDLFMGFSKELATFVYNNKLNLEQIKISPTIYENKKITFHAFDLQLEGVKKSFQDTSSLLKYYYDKTIKSDDYLLSVLKKELAKQNLKLSRLKEDYEVNQNYENYRNIADNIYASNLDLKAHYSEFMNYPLDYKLTLNQNAQKLYQKYQKQKKSLIFLENQIKITLNLIQYYRDYLDNYHLFLQPDLIDLKGELEKLNVIKQKKKKQKHTISYLSFQLEDAVCYVGKTQRQNMYITQKIGRANDLWFHVKDYPGAHVVLKGEKNKETILFAAKKALLYSSLASAKAGNVVYTEIKNIKQIKEKPGFYVSYKKEQSLYIKL